MLSSVNLTNLLVSLYGFFWNCFEVNHQFKDKIWNLISYTNFDFCGDAHPNIPSQTVPNYPSISHQILCAEFKNKVLLVREIKYNVHNRAIIFNEIFN